jgi:hypothetical protein
MLKTKRWNKLIVILLAAALPLAYNACGAGAQLSGNIGSGSSTLSTPQKQQTPIAVSSSFGAITVDFPVGSTIPLSIPLISPAVDLETVTSVSSTTVTSSAANWTSNYAGAYYLHVTYGANVGVDFLISSNTTTTLTFAATNMNALISAGDMFEIVPANTLASVFGTSTSTVVQTATSTACPSGFTSTCADSVNLWNGNAWTTYYNNGTHWVGIDSNKAIVTANADSTAIPPNSGATFTRASGPSNAQTLSLPLMGRVPPSTMAAPAPAPGTTTLLGNRFPQATTLKALGLQSIVGWVSSTTASKADQVSLWNGSSFATTYYYDGQMWRKVGSALDFDDLLIDVMTVISVQRVQPVSGQSSTSTTFTQIMPYSLNTM